MPAEGKGKRSNKKAHDPGPSIIGRGSIAFHPYSGTVMEVTDDGGKPKLKELFTIKGFAHEAVEAGRFTGMEVTK